MWSCGLSVIRSVILSVSRITAKVISWFHWNLVLYIQLYSPFGRTKIKYKHSQTRTHNKTHIKHKHARTLVKKRQERIVLHEIHLRTTGRHLSMGSHSVICLNRAGWYSIYRPRKDERLSWPGWLVIYRNGLPVHRRSPIRVLTGCDVA